MVLLFCYDFGFHVHHLSSDKRKSNPTIRKRCLLRIVGISTPTHVKALNAVLLGVFSAPPPRFPAGLEHQRCIDRHCAGAIFDHIKNKTDAGHVCNKV